MASGTHRLTRQWSSETRHSREDESFYLLEGTLALQLGGTALKNVGEHTASLLVVATPAGLENFFAEAFFPAAGVAGIPQISEALIGRVMNAAPKYGLELLVPAQERRP